MASHESQSLQYREYTRGSRLADEYRLAPVVVINVFDPARHVDDQGKPDVSKVTAVDVIGGVDAATGARKGLELIDEIFPRFRLIPGQIIAPGFSDDPAVALVIGAKCTGISGHFLCTGIADIPASVKYTEAAAWVQDNNLTDKNLVMFFGRPVFNGAEEFGSIHWAGLTAQRDSENESIPYWSPSNKRLLANGMAHGSKELMLDAAQAAALNGNGIVTGLSFIGGLVGWASSLPRCAVCAWKKWKAWTRPITRGCKKSTYDFEPLPSDDEIRAVVLALCRMTRWSLNEVLGLSFEEANWWLEGADELEKAIQGE